MTADGVLSSSLKAAAATPLTVLRGKSAAGMSSMRAVVRPPFRDASRRTAAFGLAFQPAGNRPTARAACLEISEQEPGAAKVSAALVPVSGKPSGAAEY